jgi:hypothetical protein
VESPCTYSPISEVVTAVDFVTWAMMIIAMIPGEERFYDFKAVTSATHLL